MDDLYCGEMTQYKLQNRDGTETVLLTVPVAVTLEHRQVDHPWAEDEWRVTGLILDPPEGMHGKIRQQTANGIEYFAVCDPIELHGKEAEGYLANISSDRPSVWVVMDDEPEEDGLPTGVHLVTVSAYEAQDYLDPGEMRVDVLPMPAELLEIVSAFVEAQPAPAPFRKRKRNRIDTEEHRFGKEPLAELRRRMGRDPS